MTRRQELYRLEKFGYTVYRLWRKGEHRPCAIITGQYKEWLARPYLDSGKYSDYSFTAPTRGQVINFLVKFFDGEPVDWWASQ